MNQISNLVSKITPERFFILTALLFGLCLLFMVPPFQVPDEPDHLERSFHLANGNLLGEKTDNRLGGEIPSSITQLQAVYFPIRYNYDETHTAERFNEASAIELKAEEVQFEDFPNTGLYPITAYLPQTVAVKIGSILNIKPLYILYLARIMTLFFWIFLVVKAIRTAPKIPWELAFLSLLPASLFINASASGDVVTNGVAFLVIAFCFRILTSENAKITTRGMLWLTVGIGILALNKFVYAPLLILTYAFPRKAFSNPKHRTRFALGLTVFAMLIVAAWNTYTSNSFIPKDQYNPEHVAYVTLNNDVDPQAQLKFITENPLRYLKIVVTSFVDTAPATTAHYFGKFGWEKNYLPTWLVGLLLLTTLLIFTRKAAIELSLKTKLIALGIAVIMSLGLATTLYMMWSPVGNERILSLGGRYFIPILPLVWLALPRITRFKGVKPLIIFTIALSLVIGILEVWQRYY